MTCSRDNAWAADTLGRISELMDEACVRNRIDEPIDTASASFRFETESPVSHCHFHRVISDFVRHVYREGIQPRQELSSAQASAEAIALLEKGYRGARARGCDAAFLDAVDPRHSGIDAVLAQLAEIIKDVERGKYIHWVFATSLDALTWADRRQVVELLLERLQPFLAPRLRRCEAEQLANEIPVLVTTHLSTDAMLRHVPDIATSLRDI